MKTFAGQGGSYPMIVQAGSGDLIITGSNTFANFSATTYPSTITFQAGSTQTFSNFSVSGTAGNLVTLNSTSSGTQFNLSKSSGSVTRTYLSLQDSNATGGATWTANLSTFGTNVTGWLGGVVTAVTSRFMAFF